jgi:hypothetical protein
MPLRCWAEKPSGWAVRTSWSGPRRARAGDIVIEDNQIADTRTTGRTQRYGIHKVAGAGAVVSRNDAMSGHLDRDYVEEPVKRAAR